LTSHGLKKNLAESNDLVKLWNISRSPNQASSNKAQKSLAFFITVAEHEILRNLNFEIALIFFSK
jgi:hypothetical protein